VEVEVNDEVVGKFEPVGVAGVLLRFSATGVRRRASRRLVDEVLKRERSGVGVGVGDAGVGGTVASSFIGG
jgi:hypothetical protein